MPDAARITDMIEKEEALSPIERGVLREFFGIEHPNGIRPLDRFCKNGAGYVIVLQEIWDKGKFDFCPHPSLFKPPFVPSIIFQS